MMQEKDFLAQIRKINKKVDIDTEFPDWKKSVQFIVKKGKQEIPFYFSVDGKKVAKVAKGKLPKADLIIEGSQKSLADLFEGKLTIVGAFITKELSITGTIGDAVGANVLIQAARVF
jgi:putative sterol carrier protein